MNTDTEEKPSTQRQWQEKAGAPIATREMTPGQIKEFRAHLVASYQCAPDDIDYYCEKIKDASDTDRDDCLWLVYTLKCTSANGQVSKRVIFRLKIPISEKVKRDTENMRREQMRRRAAPLQLTN